MTSNLLTFAAYQFSSGNPGVAAACAEGAKLDVSRWPFVVVFFVVVQWVDCSVGDVAMGQKQQPQKLYG